MVPDTVNPLYSKADQALWKVGEAYAKMGPRFADRSASAFQRIVRDYPLSPLVDQAKKKLQQMEREIPEPDPVALARMEYERENHQKQGLMSHFWGIFRHSPNVKAAAKSGTPAKTALRPTIPVSVPGAQGASGELSADVTVSTVTDSTALDTKPDARRTPPAAKPGNQEKK